MAFHLLAGFLEGPEASEEDSHGDGAAQFGRDLGRHGNGVIDAVGQDRIEPHLKAGKGCTVAVKVVEGVVVAHNHGKGKVPGNGRERTADARGYPGRSGRKQILNVFERGKAHAHTYGVHNTVHALVKVPALPKEQPQHKEFGRFLGDGCTEERRPELTM